MNIIKTEFKISYDAVGDLEKHRINAKDLGNAIIGMHELISTSARIVSNGASEADLMVIAPAKEGSLEVVFAILADPITTTTIMKSIGLGVVGAAASVGTALGIMDRVKDKKIERVVIDQKTKKAILHTKDEAIETTSDVAQLVSSKEIRQSLHKVIQAPLKGRAGAKISFVAGNETTTLAEEAINNFTPIRSDIMERETKERFQKVVQFTKLNFKSKRGWTSQSQDGLETSVTIKDDGFMGKVRANEEAFKKDKLYTVELEKTETTNVSGTSTKYDILRVVNELN